MEKETVKSYKQAGDIATKVLKKADKIKVGTKLLEITEQIEKLIEEEGGKHAFPLNLSRNNYAAHYAAKLNDETVIEEKDVLKVDVGVHIDGYIADCAKTIDFSGEHGKLLEASEEALANAQSILKVGLPISKIGEEVEKTIKAKGFNPIQNLSGHGLDQYAAHTYPTIPNTGKGSTAELEEDMAFAIEPFATDGEGWVKEGLEAEIFELEEPKPVRNPYARKLLNKITEEYQTLPFAERWIAKDFTEFQRKIALRDLMQKKCIHAYPVLKEEEGKLVSQAENSFIFDGEELIILVKR